MLKTKRKFQVSNGIVLPVEPSLPSVSLKQHITMYYGPPGVGKTTFVRDIAERVLFISTDRGTRFLKALRAEVRDWDDCEEVLKQLEKGGHKNYDFVCIDHVDDWANYGESWVLNKLGVEALTDAGYGKGWSVYKKLLNRYVQRLKALDTGLIFVAHEVFKTVKVRGLDVDKCMPSMNKQAWNEIIPLCDLVGYCGMRPIKKGGKRTEIRTLETTPRTDLYAKDRTRRIRPEADYEPLDGHGFINTFRKKKHAQNS